MREARLDNAGFNSEVETVEINEQLKDAGALYHYPGGCANRAELLYLAGKVPGAGLPVVLLLTEPLVGPLVQPGPWRLLPLAP